MAIYTRTIKKTGGVNFKSGINDSAPKDVVGQLSTTPVPYRRKVFWEDFLGYDLANFRVHKVEAGSGSAAIVPGDSVGGTLKITNDDAANDYVNMQLGNTAASNPTFQWNYSRDFWIDIRMKASDVSAAKLDGFFGVCQSENNIALFAHYNRIGFHFDNILGTHVFPACGNATENRTSLGAADAFFAGVGNNEYFNLSFAYNSKTKDLKWFINDVCCYSMNIGITNFVGNIPSKDFMPVNNSLMAPTIQFKNGTAGANVLEVDYIHVGVETEDRS